MISRYFLAMIGVFCRRLSLWYYLAAAAICISTGMGVAAFAGELRPSFVQNNGATPTPSGWLSLSTPGPDGVIHSIMHTAEPLKSDPDFAGMIVRCSPKLGLQVGFALIVPLPPRDKPRVRVLVSGGNLLQFNATVIPPGSIILITTDADPLTQILANSTSDLAVVVEGEQTFRGVVPLNGFGAAIASLRTHCS